MLPTRNYFTMEINELGINRDGKSITVNVSGGVTKLYILDAEQYKGKDTYKQDNLHVETSVDGAIELTLTDEDIRAEGKVRHFPGFAVILTIVVIEAGGKTYTRAVFHGEPLYRSLMEAAAELDATCRTPVWFIDKFLRFKAVEAALEAGDVTMAKKYWKEFMTHGDSPMRGRGRGGCGCHA